MMSGGVFSELAAHLAEPAARALALAMLGRLALVRTKDASLKFLVWKWMLVAALAMPVLGWAVPGLPVILPRPAWMTTDSNAQDVVTSLANPQADLRQQPLADPGILRRSKYRTANPERMNAAAPRFSSGGLPAPRQHGFPWPFVAAITYLLAAMGLLARLVVGWMLGQRLVRSAGKVNDARLLTLLADEARPCGLKRLPALAISESVAVPVTLGVFAPVIVLPAKSAEWDERKCRAVLAHELSHVARRDALTFMFSHFHRCLFWFSPLAWWLDRELRTLAEQASDDWALEQVQDGIYYAELLLGFSNDLDGAPMRVRWEGASMTKGIRVNERVERILRAPGTWPKRMRKPVAVALAIVAAPVIYFAASVRPAVAPQEPAPPAPAVAPVRPTAPAPAPAPVKPLVGIYREGPTPLPPAPPCEGVVAPAIAPPPMAAHGPIAPKLSPDGVPGAPAVAPIAPFMPTASISPCVGVVEPALAPVPPPAAAMPFPPQKPEAPVTKKPEPTNEFHGKGFSFGDDEEEGGEHYVIVEGDSISMSGSGDDAHRAKALRSKINGDYIWFHRDEKEYVITDQGTIKEAKALFAPQEELGRKQEALGKMQEELGARQEELGKHMEEIRVKLPDLRKEIKKLEAELSDIDTPKTQVELGELQAELGEMQAKIGEQMAQAGGMQGELGAKQGELGAQQGKLGREQGELGREQGRLAREANRKMKSLLDDAITRGIAKPASK